jgi:hypothetical protein
MGIHFKMAVFKNLVLIGRLTLSHQLSPASLALKIIENSAGSSQT